jgi:hypothetical protein
MDLPEVKALRLHVPEGLMEVGPGAFFVARVGLAGEKYLIPPLLQRKAVVRLAP